MTQSGTSRPVVQIAQRESQDAWHVIRAAYACAQSTRLQHVVGEYFSRTRRSTGVLQPYPLDIYIDDLLEELNDDHDTDGCIAMRPQARRRRMAVPPPHSILAYADDVTASSTTPEAAHTIDAMARHGDLWKWNCNVVKSVSGFRAPTCWSTSGMAVAGAPAAECGHGEGPRYSPKLTRGLNTASMRPAESTRRITSGNPCRVTSMCARAPSCISSRHSSNRGDAMALEIW
jgi:hypothetical protein